MKIKNIIAKQKKAHMHFKIVNTFNCDYVRRLAGYKNLWYLEKSIIAICELRDSINQYCWVKIEQQRNKKCKWGFPEHDFNKHKQYVTELISKIKNDKIKIYLNGVITQLMNILEGFNNEL